MDQASIEKLLNGQPRMRALERAFYTDKDIYQRDVERIFLRVWLYAGHSSEIPNPGDWFLFELANESVIIIRSDENTISALINVCRHRGSRILAGEKGCSRRLTCPYHGWTYGLDGKLLVSAYMDEHFDKSEHSLHGIRCEILEGMIFVNFDDQATPFDPVRENLTHCLRPYRLDRARVAHRKRYLITSNWKLAVENYTECYHCAPSHPEYSRGHALAKPGARSSGLMEQVMARAVSCGLSETSINRIYLEAEGFGADYAYERYPLWNGHITGSDDGKAVAPLLGDIRDYDGGTTDFQVGPVTFALAYCDHVMIYRFTPLSIDQVDCDITWLVNGDAQEGKDYSKDRLTWLWDVTTQADKRIIEQNAKGVASHFYRPGPYSKMEAYTWKFTEWYLDALKQPPAIIQNSG